MKFIILLNVFGDKVNLVVTMGKINEKEAANVESEKAVAPSQQSAEERTALELAEMKSQEANLMQERRDLETLKAQLSERAREELEKTKGNVQRLKTDITNLQTLCRNLTKSLNTSQTSQSTS